MTYETTHHENENPYKEYKKAMDKIERGLDQVKEEEIVRGRIGAGSGASEIVVRHLSEGNNQDRLKLEIEKNSRSTNITVSYRGSDVQEVLDTVQYVMQETKARLKQMEEEE